MRKPPLRIAVTVFPEAEELDWTGPWEVLSYWAQAHPGDGVEVFTLSRHGGEVKCARGLRVLTDHSWESAPPIDVLVYPGGRGTRAQLGDQAISRWLRDLAA
jgi:transcriptional regulator GlxA family with amidase domain